MGVLDSLKGLVGGHKAEAKKGVDEVGKVAEEKMGGAHGSEIKTAEKKADEAIDNLNQGGSPQA